MVKDTQFKAAKDKIIKLFYKLDINQMKDVEAEVVRITKVRSKIFKGTMPVAENKEEL